MVIDLKKVLREPMLHFLAIGAGLFIAFGALNPSEAENPDKIVVSSGQIEQLEAGFTKTWSRPPTPQERQRLISEYIRDEVFYREALNLGLDEGDGLIRRRLRQKLGFILEDVSALTPPSDEDLQLFLIAFEDRFRLDPKLSFQHIYLSPDRRNDIGQDAKDILTRVQAGEDAALLGDPIMLPPSYELASVAQIRRDFGEEFAGSLASVPVGTWVGPVRSGFGAHLVLVSDKTPGRLPDLAEVRDLVAREWQLEQKKALEEETFQKLLSRYDVTVVPLEEQPQPTGEN